MRASSELLTGAARPIGIAPTQPQGLPIQDTCDPNLRTFPSGHTDGKNRGDSPYGCNACKRSPRSSCSVVSESNSTPLLVLGWYPGLGAADDWMCSSCRATNRSLWMNRRAQVVGNLAGLSGLLNRRPRTIRTCLPARAPGQHTGTGSHRIELR